MEELLQGGISVWTTVNVQHLESLNDVVAAMTGVAVRERVPDSVFDGADHVELVDLEPDELMARLREGKIYAQAQAQHALGHFFLPANLIALRETALRRMADRINRRAIPAEPGVKPHGKSRNTFLSAFRARPATHVSSARRHAWPKPFMPILPPCSCATTLRGTTIPKVSEHSGKTRGWPKTWERPL